MADDAMSFGKGHVVNISLGLVVLVGVAQFLLWKNWTRTNRTFSTSRGRGCLKDPMNFFVISELRVVSTQGVFYHTMIYLLKSLVSTSSNLQFNDIELQHIHLFMFSAFQLLPFTLTQCLTTYHRLKEEELKSIKTIIAKKTWGDFKMMVKLESEVLSYRNGIAFGTYRSLITWISRIVREIVPHSPELRTDMKVFAWEVASRYAPTLILIGSKIPLELVSPLFSLLWYLFLVSTIFNFAGLILALESYHFRQVLTCFDAQVLFKAVVMLVATHQSTNSEVLIATPLLLIVFDSLFFSLYNLYCLHIKSEDRDSFNEAGEELVSSTLPASMSDLSRTEFRDLSYFFAKNKKSLFPAWVRLCRLQKQIKIPENPSSEMNFVRYQSFLSDLDAGLTKLDLRYENYERDFNELSRLTLSRNALDKAFRALLYNFTSHHVYLCTAQRKRGSNLIFENSLEYSINLDAKTITDMIPVEFIKLGFEETRGCFFFLCMGFVVLPAKFNVDYFRQLLRDNLVTSDSVFAALIEFFWCQLGCFWLVAPMLLGVFPFPPLQFLATLALSVFFALNS